jgi:protein-S-isoprenylcysteine O-methyltransferase Ste14
MTPEWTIAALWILWLLSWGVASAWSSRREKRSGMGAEIIFRVLLLVGSVLLFVIPAGGRFERAQLWRLDWHSGDAKWILVAVTLAGFSITWWARIRLGRLWSAWGVQKKPGHHVVDSGPYRYVRHPIYTGLILAALATAVEKGSGFALLGAGVIAFAFYRKARVEERFLRAELGEEAYGAYARRTAMLVPGVRRGM